MRKSLKIFFYGFLLWLIPFVTSIFFFDKTGKHIIDIFLFKTIMIVEGGLTSAILIAYYFNHCKENYLREGILTGAVWLFVNWVLDFMILIPMAKMNVSAYFTSIGLRYLLIPIFTITIGMLLERHHELYDEG